MTTKPYILVQVEGGLIRDISHNYPFDIRIITIDGDTEGMDEPGVNVGVYEPTPLLVSYIPLVVREALANFAPDPDGSVAAAATDEEIWACIETMNFEPLLEDE